MRRRVKLIFNPHAHRGRAWGQASTLQAILARYGDAEWAATEHPGQGTPLAQEAARQGFDIVAALGGDGTANEVINGLMRVPADRRPLMAVVPVGSGNDFASNVGVKMDADQAMQRVFAGDPRTIDLGEVTDQAGRTRYFGNVLGIGFDAIVTLYSYRSKRLQGFAMYLWCVIQTILRNHDAPLLTIANDEETYTQNALMYTICNGPREGGGFFVAPDAKLDDGLLHYACIKRVSRLMMFRLIPEVMNGTHGRFKEVRLGHFKDMTLKSDRPLVIQIDGEILAGFQSDVTGLHVRVLPGALQMIV